MESQYVLQNIKIYNRNLNGTSAQSYFMNQISTDYIRAYMAGQKLDSDEEKKVIKELLSYFEEIQEYKRCAQLKRILEGEPLSKEYVF
jgi:hypothetical protein